VSKTGKYKRKTLELVYRVVAVLKISKKKHGEKAKIKYMTLLSQILSAM
jgi:hypothetical protein